MAFQLPAEIETKDQLDTLLSNGDFSFYFAYNEDGPWIIYSDDYCNWWGLRPVSHDDAEFVRLPWNGVLDMLEALTLPLTLVGGY